MNQGQNGAQPQKIHNPFEVLQPGEQNICEIKRHPIGLFGVYSMAAIVMAAAIAAAILVPTYLPDLSSQAKLGVVLGALLAVGVTLLYTYVAVTVYNGNRWIVTSDSITQVEQAGLFNKQTSQLSLANLEDVTVDQDGILESMFGFGELRIESAGARGKFIFDFCPNPNDYARKIIAAHEAYIANNPEETRVTNRPLANTETFNQPGGTPAA